jgi:hypothetical protein
LPLWPIQLVRVLPSGVVRYTRASGRCCYCQYSTIPRVDSLHVSGEDVTGNNAGDPETQNGLSLRGCVLCTIPGGFLTLSEISGRISGARAGNRAIRSNSENPLRGLPEFRFYPLRVPWDGGSSRCSPEAVRMCRHGPLFVG